MEVLQDLTNGLCELYRLGRIKPVHDPTDQLQTSYLRKRKEKPPLLNGRAEGEPDGDERRPFWERGGTVALPLSLKLESLLGLYPMCQDDAIKLGQKDSDKKDASQPANRSNSAGLSQAYPKHGSYDKIKKSVSFSRLPPKHRSSLDSISSRQARSAIIPLYYICALVAFSSISTTEMENAKGYWEKILLLAADENGFSKEADEIVGKAKIRLEMLVDPLAGQRLAAKNHMDMQVDLPSSAKDLTILHMLSPPANSSIGSASAFDFHSLDDQESGATTAVEKSVGIPIPKGHKRKDERWLSKLGSSPTDNNDYTNTYSSHTSHKDASQPSLQLLSPSAQSAHNYSSSRSPRRAKFSIPDSPTSVRSHMSKKEGAARSRGNSNASSFGTGTTRSSDAMESAKLQAPWSLRRPISLTSLSLPTPNLPFVSTKHSSISNGRHVSSPTILQSAPSYTSTLRKPHFLPSLSGHRWLTKSSSLSPLAYVSDPSVSTIDSLDLRKNSTSVASLPHLSISGKNGAGRSFLALHLLYNHQNDSGKGSSSSLASLGSGIQKSFTSLKNYFTPAPSTAIQDDEQLEQNEGSMVGNTNDAQENSYGQLHKRLEDSARRHDETLSEIEYWKRVDDQEKNETDSWNTTLSDAFAGELAAIDQVDEPVSCLQVTGGYKDPSPDSLLLSTADAADPSQTNHLKPLSLPNLPSRILTKSKRPVPVTPPGTPSSTHHKRHYGHAKRRGGLPPLWTEDIDADSVPASGVTTPIVHSGIAESETPGPLNLDPLLAALEAASRVNVKSRCAVCARQGVNFPKCQKCEMTFCSRECRMSTGQNGETRHACI